MTRDLPITDILPALVVAIERHGRAVLQAPPGAGKTTGVPLALLPAASPKARIVMLEPRRLAARAAAARLAELSGRPLGKTVGLRMRGRTDVSDETCIEVVTEGILTRMLQSDPALTGIATVIFDEFHERSLNADFGLALCLDARAALRPDLRLLVMSATLDADPVAALMGDAPVLTSEGKSFPVEVVWRDRPGAGGLVDDLVHRALAETAGSVLVFLPGAREIEATAGRLSGTLGAGVTLHRLYGALPFADQRAAVAPPPNGQRKVVLATSIAETSLTIEGITAVVDAGAARRARFDPGTGMSRLVTEPASRAETEQRAGRAGRLGPGKAYRDWAKAENGALPAFAPAEIETADLTGLALDLADWGTDGADLSFLTHPPAAAFAEARGLLRDLGALDAGGQITPAGRAMARLPLHPRLAHLLGVAGPQAATLAATLSRPRRASGQGADIEPALKALDAETRKEAARLSRAVATPGTEHDTLTPGEMLALAYPDRIAQRRKGEAPRYLLSGGRGARLDPSDTLAGEPWLVAADLDGQGAEPRIRAAARIDEAALRAIFAGRIEWDESCRWSAREGRVLTERRERLGALSLRVRPWDSALPEVVAAAMLEGVRTLGLPDSTALRRLQARVAAARAGGADLPDLSTPALLENLENWLAPFIGGLRSARDWQGFDIMPALSAMLSHAQRQTLDRLAPARFQTPLGRQIEIDYGNGPPAVAARVQEFFGLGTHPVIAGVPLTITLLSPAGRPVQTTSDLPGFWRTSYADVRKDMRGRYPKHPWPEDPLAADPTLRAKPRGT